MSRDRFDGPHPRYAVVQVERDRTGHHALASMSGPEFTGTGAVFASLNLLPPGARLAAFAVLVLIGMAGCTAAWIDQQDYQPSPNICRQLDAGVPPEPAGTCIPRGQAPGAPR